jgi:hypothetical protein
MYSYPSEGQSTAEPASKPLAERERALWIASGEYMHGKITKEQLEDEERLYAYSYIPPKATPGPFMGAFRKILLVPIPFCIATAVSSTFWNLGQMSGWPFLGGLTAVLCYPLILGLLLLRLLPPIRHTPILSIKQKLVSIPIVMGAAIIAGRVWFVVVDHSGTSSNPWDLSWWCGLIGITCALLAYL